MKKPGHPAPQVGRSENHTCPLQVGARELGPHSWLEQVKITNTGDQKEVRQLCIKALKDFNDDKKS